MILINLKNIYLAFLTGLYWHLLIYIIYVLREAAKKPKNKAMVALYMCWQSPDFFGCFDLDAIMNSSKYQSVFTQHVWLSDRKLKMRRDFIFQFYGDFKHTSSSNKKRRKSTFLEWPSLGPEKIWWETMGSAIYKSFNNIWKVERVNMAKSRCGMFIESCQKRIVFLNEMCFSKRYENFSNQVNAEFETIVQRS